MTLEMLQILKYLFDVFTDMGPNISIPEPDKLFDDLEKAGFKTDVILNTFKWLQELANKEETNALPKSNSNLAIRVYTYEECLHLSTECRGYLVYLEQIGILDPVSREVIIERAMNVDSNDLDLEHLKWIVASVLTNLPSLEMPTDWLEHIIFSDKAYD